MYLYLVKKFIIYFGSLIKKSAKNISHQKAKIIAGTNGIICFCFVFVNILNMEYINQITELSIMYIIIKSNRFIIEKLVLL